MLDTLRTFIRRAPLVVVAVMLLAGVLAAVGAGLVAAAGPDTRAQRLQQNVSDLSAALGSAQGREAAAEDRADAAESQVEDLKGQLALSDYKARKKSLAGQVADLQQQVVSEQAKLQHTKQEVARSSFGDGTWQANVDFIPGTYEAAGGPDCYWAKLSGPSGQDDILDNGGFNPRQIVSIDSPYFQTSSCGTWHRTG